MSERVQTEQTRALQGDTGEALEEALKRADDPEVRYHIRQAMQLLMT